MVKGSWSGLGTGMTVGRVARSAWSAFLILMATASCGDDRGATSTSQSCVLPRAVRAGDLQLPPSLAIPKLKHDLVFTFNTAGEVVAVGEEIRQRGLSEPGFADLMRSILIIDAENVLLLEFGSSEELHQRGCQVLEKLGLSANKPVDRVVVDEPG